MFPFNFSKRKTSDQSRRSTVHTPSTRRTMWEWLSEELQHMILERSTLAERLALEQCSHTLCRLFRTGGGPKWTWVTFPPALRPRLTDAALASFLTRVDARRHTRGLDLSGCGRIRGSGLAPLAGSTILTELHLRVHGWREAAPVADPLDRLDHALFATLLPADGPFCEHDGPLRKLTIHRQQDHANVPPPAGHPHSRLVDFDAPWTFYLRRLQLARRDDDAVCGNCERAIAEVHTGPQPPWGRAAHLLSNECDSCEEHTCECGFGYTRFESGFPCPRLEECRACGLTLCEHCSMERGPSMSTCTACHPLGVTYCSTCRYMMTCEACGQDVCIECDSQIELRCHCCGSHFCSDCQEMNECPVAYCDEMCCSTECALRSHFSDESEDEDGESDDDDDDESDDDDDERESDGDDGR
jgi:hypothetical protein